MGFYDAFFGSEQSQYTAYAIVAAIIAICITILLTATDIPVSNRLLIVFFVIISLVPSVFLTLFELTCIVTGGTEPNHWWCYAFAWVLAAFIIIYCIFIVIISLISLFTYNNAIDNVKMEEEKGRLTPDVSNNYAKQIIDNDEKHTRESEKFYVQSSDMASINSEQDNKKNNSPIATDPLSYIMGGSSSTQTLTDSFENQHFNNYDKGHSNKKDNSGLPDPAGLVANFQNKDIAHFYGGSSTDGSVETKSEYTAVTQSKEKEQEPVSERPSLLKETVSERPSATKETVSSAASATKEPMPVSSSTNARFTDLTGQEELFTADGYYPFSSFHE